MVLNVPLPLDLWQTHCMQPAQQEPLTDRKGYSSTFSSHSARHFPHDLVETKMEVVTEWMNFNVSGWHIQRLPVLLQDVWMWKNAVVCQKFFNIVPVPEVVLAGFIALHSWMQLNKLVNIHVVVFHKMFLYISGEDEFVKQGQIDRSVSESQTGIYPFI